MDSVGKLFWRKGNLYRGIRPQMAAFYGRLLEQGVIDELVQKGLLIDTWKADWSTPEFPLVLQHRVLPVVSFAAEWCASQLKAAALAVLDLELALRPKSLTLWDVSPWNVLFESAHPYYVDFCSISRLSSPNEWRARDQFSKFFLHPLLLFQNGLPRVARRLLFDPVVGVPYAELKALIPTEEKGLPASTSKLRAIFDRFRRRRKAIAAEKDASWEISALRHFIDSFSFSLPKTQWAGYHDDNFPEFTPSDKWTKKHHSVDQILNATKPTTVLDLGSNRGWYAQLAAHHGARVIAADSDDISINQLYSDVKTLDLPITPIFMDFRFPEPAQGPGYKMIASAADRLKSEMVLALALVHHLVFTWYITFDQIVDNLEMFSSKWVAVEFIGTEDTVVREGLGWSELLFPWYSLDGFRKSLERRFDVLEKFPSDWGGLPNKGGRMGTMDRTILLCKRRTAT